jgi:glycine oxidase
VPDAIVIGGGVMGLAVARELRTRGYTVSLLERAQPGRAASWASAGIIGATVREESDPSYQLRRVSEALWPSFAAALIAESGFDPEYRENGCLYLAADERVLAWLAGVEARSRAGEQGRQTSLQLLDRVALRAAEPALGESICGALLVPGGNVEPRRLCRALEIAARRAGVVIRGGVEVLGIQTAGDRAVGVETADGSIPADLIVVAAGAWSAALRGVQPVPPVRPQRGQILAVDQAGVGVQHVLMTPGDPYFVPRADGRLVIGATREEAGWDPSLTVGGVAWLLERAMSVVPALRGSPLVELWTGFRPQSEDGLPLIGAGALRELYFLTGHGPSGISPLPGSVQLLSALIAGEAPPLPAAPFDPRRFNDRKS